MGAAGRDVQGGWWGKREPEGEIHGGREESNTDALSLGTVRCPKTLMDTSTAAPQVDPPPQCNEFAGAQWSPNPFVPPR